MELSVASEVLHRRIRLIVVVALIAAGAALLVSLAMPRVYESTTTLIVGGSLSQQNPDYNQLLASQQLVSTYATVATTRPILADVISSLGLATTTDELAKHVFAEAGKDNTLLTIKVEYPDSQGAASIANAVAQQVIKRSPTLQGLSTDIQGVVQAVLDSTRLQIVSVQSQISQLEANTERTQAEESQLEQLQSRLVTLEQTFASLLNYTSTSAANRLAVVEPAAASADPASPRLPLNVLLGGLLGMVIATSAAFVFENLDDTVKSPEDVQAYLGLPTLGLIERMPLKPGRSPIYSVATLTTPRSPVAEAFRALRTNIEFAGIDTPLRTILVTSAMPGEGKTMVAANLAVAFAQAGRRTLLVDADLRRPEVHKLFGLQDSSGLTTILRVEMPALGGVAQSTQEPNLRVIPAGPLPPNPAELLGSKRMQAVLGGFRESTDLVILDSSPLEIVTDAAILASIVDGTLLVMQARKSRRRNVKRGYEALERVGARVLGATLNRVPRSSGEYLFRYLDASDGQKEQTAVDGPPAGAPLG